MTLVQRTSLLLTLCFNVIGAKAAGPLEGTLTLPIGVELHLQGAGIKDSDGSYPAASRSGRYQLKFPIPYDEWTASIGDRDAQTYNLSATSAEGIKFLATEFSRTGKEQFSDAKALAKSFLGNKRRSSSRSFKHDGIDGFESTIRTRKTITVTRFLLTEEHYYQLSVEYPRKKRAIGKAVSEKFLTSLILTNKQK